MQVNSKSLLLIDDNNDFITLVKLFLEFDTDWKVFMASDSREGVVKAQKFQPDLILLDVAMPYLDGIATYKILKSNQVTRSIPTIFLTAMIGIEKGVQLEVNADVEVITKPISIISFKKQIINLYARYLFLIQ